MKGGQEKTLRRVANCGAVFQLLPRKAKRKSATTTTKETTTTTTTTATGKQSNKNKARTNRLRESIRMRHCRVSQCERAHLYTSACVRVCVEFE